MLNKVLYMLIGPKGSGKTYIGKLVNTYTNIQFIQVESIWLNLQAGEDGWKKVEQAIDIMFESHNQVMIESLGAGEEFSKFHIALKKKYTLKMIRVYADLEICFTRVKSRNQVEQLPIADAQVQQYNKIAATVTYDWELEIDNNAPASDQTILAAIQTLSESPILGDR